MSEAPRTRNPKWAATSDISSEDLLARAYFLAYRNVNVAVEVANDLTTTSWSFSIATVWGKGRPTSMLVTSNFPPSQRATVSIVLPGATESTTE